MYIVIFITTANKKEAGKIAACLVREKLAACVNIADKIESIFWWQGKVDKTKETLLIIKAQRKKLTKIIKRVEAMHSYQIPEIIALPVISGNKNYLRWIDESLR
jgi:periplasmic divalent cation tolerance protein